MGWLQTRINPSDPLISPLRADLSRLPPVLVQASEVEMLYDDARRYVNRAQAAGSPVRLQTWNHMVHVWQIFNPELPEAEQALAEIGKFLEAAAPRERLFEPRPCPRPQPREFLQTEYRMLEMQGSGGRDQCLRPLPRIVAVGKGLHCGRGGAAPRMLGSAQQKQPLQPCPPGARPRLPVTPPA